MIIFDRSTPPVGLLAPARHVLPSTSYGLPPTTRSISPLIKEQPKSVIEKILPDKSDIKKQLPISLPAQIYTQSSYASLPTSIHMTNAEIKPPATPVIHEVPSPKIMPLPSCSIPEIRNSQQSIIQQAPSHKSITSLQEMIDR